MSTRILPNLQVGTVPGATFSGADPLAFHRRLPGYAPTACVALPHLAERLGVGHIWVKNESSRLGLPSFKILGASWATYCALAARLGQSLEPWETLDDLRDRLSALLPLTLVAATDGNHGRAVARMAALLGLRSRILVPAGMASARLEAIAAEGAEIVMEPNGYDDAVRRSAAEEGEHTLVISDTSWPGYEQVPSWVIEGYSTIFREVDEQLAALADSHLDLVMVQIGVGALAAAAVLHYRRATRRPVPQLIGVEPAGAACVLASIEAGRPISIPYSHDSSMAGLNCGTPSPVAWPAVSTGVGLFLSIEDRWAEQAMRELAAAEVVAGETGAAGLAGLLALFTGPDASARRSSLGLSATSSILVICTEGATDPENYRRIIAAE